MQEIQQFSVHYSQWYQESAPTTTVSSPLRLTTLISPGQELLGSGLSWVLSSTSQSSRDSISSTLIEVKSDSRVMKVILPAVMTKSIHSY
jgi:hypothetical protein